MRVEGNAENEHCYNGLSPGIAVGVPSPAWMWLGRRECPQRKSKLINWVCHCGQRTDHPTKTEIQSLRPVVFGSFRLCVRNDQEEQSVLGHGRRKSQVPIAMFSGIVSFAGHNEPYEFPLYILRKRSYFTTKGYFTVYSTSYVKRCSKCVKNN